MTNRELPYVNALGTVDISKATSVEEALEYARLNWEVVPSKVYDEKGIEIPGFVANQRSDTGDTLGIVSSKYSIIQNREAFDFVNELPLQGDFTFTSAGIFNNGKAAWVMGKLPQESILGDEVDNNLVFVNSHDGSTGVKIMMTPIRVICSNMLNLAMREASRSWNTKHTRYAMNRLEEARYTLGLANKYMEKLKEEAERLSSLKVTEGQIEAILFKNNFFSCYNASDISKFKGTAWGAINAMADLIDHNDPGRMTNNYYANHWKKLVNGHNTFDRFYNEIR